jgi:hypothetical protein
MRSHIDQIKYTLSLLPSLSAIVRAQVTELLRNHFSTSLRWPSSRS